MVWWEWLESKINIYNVPYHHRVVMSVPQGDYCPHQKSNLLSYNADEMLAYGSEPWDQRVIVTHPSLGFTPWRFASMLWHESLRCLSQKVAAFIVLPLLFSSMSSMQQCLPAHKFPKQSYKPLHGVVPLWAPCYCLPPYIVGTLLWYAWHDNTVPINLYTHTVRASKWS